jgi:hypothetical protein
MRKIEVKIRQIIYQCFQTTFKIPKTKLGFY